jgi:3-hydroxybutyryl-CoA dehydrogenase
MGVDERPLGIVGAGVMGRGIAQVAVTAGRPVILIDVDRDQVARATEEVDRRLARLVEKGALSDDQRVASIARLGIGQTATDLASCDVVIEAATESLAIKRTIVADLEAACEETTILASNTSSLSIADIADGALHPERLLGVHFFNPAPVMHLVEIIPGRATSDATIEAAQALARALGKEPVIASDRPGFIVSRVLDVMINEAVRCVMDGNDPADVDLAMRLGANLPIGPLALADLMGLDILKSVMERLESGFGSAAYAPAPLLVDLVEQGRLGRKSGRGFFDYPSP